MVNCITNGVQVNNGNLLRNENGALIEVVGVEPSGSVESMCWYNPFVDVHVRVFDEKDNFSVCFTINKYVVPEEYVPENWHLMSNKEVWDVTYQNIYDNLGNLNVLNAIIPIENAVEVAMDEYCNELDFEDGSSEDGILTTLLDKSHWNILESSMAYDFKVLKYECAVSGNSIEDYITEFEVEQNY